MDRKRGGSLPVACTIMTTRWIGIAGDQQDAEPGSEERRLPARYLRHAFGLTELPERALSRTCGLGVSYLYVNGRRADDRLLAPGMTNFSKRALVVENDVTDLLLTGENVIGVLLGNGRFHTPRIGGPDGNLAHNIPLATDFGLPRLFFELDLEYADGRVETIVSDETWRATDQGPTRINNEYDGEEYDARMEMPGWAAPGYDADDWPLADRMDAPCERLDLHDCPPDKITEELPARSITTSPEGGWIVDFGRNFYGNVRCQTRGPRGTRVSWRAAYSLRADGSLRTEDNRSAEAYDSYTLKGEGEETWSPLLRGQGMRRIHVIEWPEGDAPGLADFTGQVINADLAVAGEFHCSDAQINRLAENIRWGQGMYLRHGLAVDPDRDERQGWLGDLGMNLPSVLYNWEAERLLRNWLIDIELEQLPSGQLPHVAPALWEMYELDVVWPAAFVLMAQSIREFTGTTSHLRTRYGGIRAWMHYVKDSLTNPDGTTDVNRYGDWNDAGTMGTTDYIGKNSSQSFISSAVWLACLEAAAEIATVIDETEDAELYRRWRAESRTGFLRRFVDPVTASTPNDSQTELAMLFALDIIDAGLREPAKALLDEAVRQADGHPTGGLVGMSVLFEGLARAGCWDAAWALLSCRTRPSWGYMIDKGATTMWEHWDGDTRDPAMNSEALLLLAGNINRFLFESIGGIGQAEGSTGFGQIALRPVVLGDLSEASAWYQCPRGRIESRWVRGDGRFTWDVTIPPGLPAEAQLPEGYRLAASSAKYGHEDLLRLSPGRHHIEADAD